MKRERHHRSYIRAYLFDLIFKIFLSILDESLSRNDGFMKAKEEEWEMLMEKRVTAYEEEIAELKLRIVGLNNEREAQEMDYEIRLKQLNEERAGLQANISGYKTDLASLLARGDRDNAMDSMRANLREAITCLNSASKEIEAQQEAVFPVMNMIREVAENPTKIEAGT